MSKNDRFEKIISNIAKTFFDFGEELGFSAPIIRYSSDEAEIYFPFNGHALQIEIDQHDFNLFMYVCCSVN